MMDNCFEVPKYEIKFPCIESDTSDSIVSSSPPSDPKKDEEDQLEFFHLTFFDDSGLYTEITQEKVKKGRVRKLYEVTKSVIKAMNTIKETKPSEIIKELTKHFSEVEKISQLKSYVKNIYSVLKVLVAIGFLLKSRSMFSYNVHFYHNPLNLDERQDLTNEIIRLKNNNIEAKKKLLLDKIVQVFKII